MSPSVEIDDDIFEFLKSQAEPFVDTPSSVLRRLIGINGSAARDEGQEALSAGATAKPAAGRAPKRGKAKKPGTRIRAAAGTLLPESDYERPLLQALVDVGGQAPYRTVVDAVGEALKDSLKPADFETLASGGIRWHSRLQFVRLRLIERGELDKEAPRGVWRITDAGRQALMNGGPA